MLNKKRLLLFVSAGCFFLSLVFQPSAYAYFGFNESAYSRQFEWSGSGPLKLELDINLQSCIGLQPTGGLWAGGCDFFRTVQEYTLLPENFDFTAAGTSPNLIVERAAFEVSGQQTKLNAGEISDVITPATWRAFKGTVILELNEEVLKNALPGNYFSRFTLEGSEAFLIEDSDSTNLSYELKIPALFKISGLKDVGLTDQNTSEAMNFCVFAQGGSGFQIEALGLNEAFKLSNEIPYTITMVQGAKKESLSPGQAAGGWTGHRDANCSGGSNVQLDIDVPDTSYPAGVYSDIVTVTVSPES